MLCARCKANGQGRCASPGKETDAVSLGINAGYRCAGRTENAVALDNQTGEDGGFAWLCSHYPVYWAELPILASWLRLAPQSLMLLNITVARSEEHTSELQSPCNLVCRLLLEKKNIIL